jgi:kynurenine 3-monooxygenase
MIIVLDIRMEQSYRGRSINLALSTRGILALRGAKMNLDDEALKEAIPMRSRMIHTQDGKLSSQAYGVHGEVSV